MSEKNKTMSMLFAIGLNPLLRSAICNTEAGSGKSNSTELQATGPSGKTQTNSAETH